MESSTYRPERVCSLTKFISPVDIKAAKVATRAQKSNYRYSDFYCYMTFSDFNAYIAQDDDDDDSFPISAGGRASNA